MSKILLVEDDLNFRKTLVMFLSENFDLVEAENGAEALKILESEKDIDLIISDQIMEPINGCDLLKNIRQRGLNTSFILITAYGSVQTAVEAMKLGANDFIQKPFSLSDIKRAIERVLEVREDKGLSLLDIKLPIVTKHPKMITLLKICEIIARSDCTVLIEGESGVGKEVIARAIHSMSPRRNGPCIVINCGAIPDHLLESELFGFEKGSFTGADRRKLGKIELAHNGTLVLDEVSELPLNLQVKLLRVLQDRKVERLGSTESQEINFRLIAISNKSLLKCCNEGKFRFDLYYRLNVMPLFVPPLRERKEDIPLLANYFLKKFCPKFSTLPANICEKLMEYDWPGNVRELQNACERVAVLSQGGIGINENMFFSDEIQNLGISVDKLENFATDSAPTVEVSDKNSIMIKVGMSLEEVERILILETLKVTNFNQTKAAEILGITSRTLRNKLAEYKRLNLI